MNNPARRISAERFDDLDIVVLDICTAADALSSTLVGISRDDLSREQREAIDFATYLARQLERHGHDADAYMRQGDRQQAAEKAP
jgi:hypothetical protein